MDHECADDEAWTAWWTKWPISRWLDKQNGFSWFRRIGDTFVFAPDVSLHCQWHRVAEDLARATQIASDIGWWWLFDALTSLRTGDKQRYLADCEQLLRLVRGNPNAHDIRWMCAWVFSEQFGLIEDVPGIREFLRERLEQLESAPGSNGMRVTPCHMCPRRHRCRKSPGRVMAMCFSPVAHGQIGG